MESQLTRPVHGHHDQYAQDPHLGSHSVIEGEGEHDHHVEKKSVLKKVKDKAKKIKNTITKHGHGQEHGHEDEDDDDDEEMVDDPEVHGAPMYDSSVIRSTDLPRQIDVNLEKPTEHREDTGNVRDESYTRNVGRQDQTFDLGETVPEMRRMQAHIPEAKDTSLPFDSTTWGEPNVEEPRVQIRPMRGLEEDPHGPKVRPEDIPSSNYQSKVTDLTGQDAKEADVDPLVQRLDKLNVQDEPKSELGSGQRGFTGSHDQFAPQPTPTNQQFNPGAIPVSSTTENPESIPKTVDSSNPDLSMAPRDTVAGKISSATSAITEKAVSAKNIVASKLGYGGSVGQGQDTAPDALKKPGTESPAEYAHTPDAPKKPLTESAAEYAHTIAEKLAPVYDKVAGAGTAVMSKVQGTSASENPAPGSQVESASVEHKGSDKGVSVKEYLAEKFRPGDEDKALSEAITGALHMRKEGVAGTGEGESHPPLGKVTVSKEVAERLGTDTETKREGEDAFAAGRESSGQGVVDRLKDAVGSWLGKSAGMQTAQESLGQSHVSDGGSASATISGTGQGDEGAGRKLA